MPDRPSAHSQLLQVLFQKHLRYQTHAAMNVERLIWPFRSHHPCTFLAAMLQGKKSVISQECGIGMTVHGKNATLMSWFARSIHDSSDRHDIFNRAIPRFAEFRYF